jgi:hypothetical protein
MDAAEVEMPQSGGCVLLTAILCRGAAGRLPAATTDLLFLAMSPPKTFDARPWIAVHEPPKESSREGSFLGSDLLGLSAGLVREGYLLGIAGDPDREPKGESLGEASRALGLVEKSPILSSKFGINLAVRGRKVEAVAGVELVLEVV